MTDLAIVIIGENALRPAAADCRAPNLRQLRYGLTR